MDPQPTPPDTRPCKYIINSSSGKQVILLYSTLKTSGKIIYSSSVVNKLIIGDYENAGESYSISKSLLANRRINGNTCLRSFIFRIPLIDTCRKNISYSSTSKRLIHSDTKWHKIRKSNSFTHSRCIRLNNKNVSSRIHRRRQRYDNTIRKIMMDDSFYRGNGEWKVIPHEKDIAKSLKMNNINGISGNEPAELMRHEYGLYNCDEDILMREKNGHKGSSQESLTNNESFETTATSVEYQTNGCKFFSEVFKKMCT